MRVGVGKIQADGEMVDGAAEGSGQSAVEADQQGVGAIWVGVDAGPGAEQRVGGQCVGNVGVGALRIVVLLRGLSAYRPAR